MLGKDRSMLTFKIISAGAAAQVFSAHSFTEKQNLNVQAP